MSILNSCEENDSAPSSFFLFLKSFALDAEGGDRPGFEPLVGNVSVTALADPVGRYIHPFQGLVDLLE